MNSSLNPNPYIRIPQGKATKDFLAHALEYYIQCIIFGAHLTNFTVEQKVILLLELSDWIHERGTPAVAANQAAMLRQIVEHYSVKIDMASDVASEEKSDYRDSCRLFYACAREYGLSVPAKFFTNFDARLDAQALVDQLVAAMFPVPYEMTPMREVSREEYFAAAEVIGFEHLAKDALGWPNGRSA